MSNRLNFSSLNDAWGSTVEESKPRVFSYQKPKENIMTINSNEVKKDFTPVKETYSGYIKPCSLVDEHISKCEVCRNKLLETISKSKLKINNNDNNTITNTNSVIDKLSNKEHMSSNILNEYLDTNFDLNEHFENLSPSHKNLIIVILYGILIILISDLIIKEEI
jgi:hypothetical protein